MRLMACGIPSCGRLGLEKKAGGDSASPPQTFRHQLRANPFAAVRSASLPQERSPFETALRDSEAFIRLLLDSTSEAFYSVDTAGKTTLCNTALCRQYARFSQAPRTSSGAQLHEVIHHSYPDGSPYKRARIARSIAPAASGEPARVSAMKLFFRLDGTRLSRRIPRRARSIRDGVLQGAICTFIDIDRPPRRRGRAAAKRGPAANGRTSHAQPRLDGTSRTACSTGSTSRAFHYTGLRAKANSTGEDWVKDRPPRRPRRCKPVRAGPRHMHRAGKPTRPNSGCAGMTAPTAGILRAPCPCAAPPAPLTRWIGTNTDIEDQKSAAARRWPTRTRRLEQRVAERTAERDRVWRNAQDLMAVTTD